jgi:hypothetical protein
MTSGLSPRQVGSVVDRTFAALLIGTCAVLAGLVLAMWLAVFSHPADPAAPPGNSTVGPPHSEPRNPDNRERR